MELEIGQILTQIVAFLIMLWVLKKFAWKPILKVLDERTDKIQKEFEGIEKQKNEIQSLKNEYKSKIHEIEMQSRVVVQKAVDQAQETARDIQKEAHKQARAILNKAEGEIERQMEKAKMELKSDIVNLTIAATEKVIGENLNTEKQKKLITEFVEQSNDYP